MKTLLVARKSLLEMRRDPKSLALVLLLPVGFVALFAAIGSSPRQPTYDVALAVTGPGGDAVARSLDAERYRDGRAVFRVRRVARDAPVDGELRSGALTARVHAETTPEGAATFTLRGDATNARFVSGGTVLAAWTARYAAASRGERELLRTEPRALSEPEPRTDFDLYLPGCIVFALLLSVAQTAILLGQERRAGTLQRLALSRVHTASVLGGVALAQLALGVVQVALIFAAARAFGFHNRASLLPALLAMLLVQLSGVGLGLVVAALVRNDSQASNVGGVVAMLQVFLAGAFFPMPASTLAALGPHELGAYDLFPATHGFAALQQVLCYGSTLAQVRFRLLAALLLTLAYFALGVAVFQRRSGTVFRN